MLRRALIAAALCAAGCAEDPTSVLVEVSARPGLTVASLSAQVTLGTGQTMAMALPPGGGAPAIPGQVVIVLSTDAATSVSVSLSGLDGAGCAIAATGSVQSKPHDQVPLPLVLDGQCLPGDGGLPDLAQGAPDLAGADLGKGGFMAQNSGTTHTLYGVHGSGAGDVFAVGEAGTIVHSPGNGAWAAQNSTVTTVLTSVWAIGSDNIFAVGSEGTILHSDSTAWTKQTSGVSVRLSGVWASAPNDVWVVGEGGTVLHSDGNGTWNARTSGVTAALNAVHGGDAGETVIAGTAPAGVIHTSNGTQFSVMDATDTLYGMWSGVACGKAGLVTRRNGASWSADPAAAAMDLHGIWSSSATDVWSCGLAGTLVHGSTTAQTAAASNTAADLYGVWGSSATDVYLVGSGGTIMHGP